MLAVVTLAFFAGFLISAIGGYWLGWQHQAGSAERQQRKDDPFVATLAAMAEAGRRCQALARAVRLSERQVAELLDRQKSLAAILTTLSTISSEPQVREPLVWELQPTDEVTGLPNESAFLQNIERLTAATPDHRTAAVLLVTLDRAENLQSRLGRDAMLQLRRTFAGLICRTAREQDCTASLGFDQFAVLFAPDSEKELLNFARRVRDVLGHHAFRHPVDGNELLVSASFGLTPCACGEAAQIVLDRAQVALSASQRRGRNKLHVYLLGTGRVELLA